MCCRIGLLIESHCLFNWLLIPIELPRSWAGPGPGPDRLGLKCYLAWGGTRVVGGGGKGKFHILES